MSDSASINATARTISQYIVSQYGLQRFLHFMHDLGGPGQRADFSSAHVTVWTPGFLVLLIMLTGSGVREPCPYSVLEVYWIDVQNLMGLLVPTSR